MRGPDPGTRVNAPCAQPCFAAHYPARLLVTITIEVLLMPCWRMPQLTKRLARWIHPRRHMA